jgi:hypothetical protein
MCAHELTFEDALDRLRRSRQVEGVLTIGSRGQPGWNAASDYDLVIVRPQSAAWFVGVTRIEGRFADLIFVGVAALERVLALDAPVEGGHELAPIIRWLSQGRIEHSRSDLLPRAQAQARQREWIAPDTDQSAVSAWFAINYNLAQARRMLRSADPLYRAAVAIRMAVCGPADLWFGYFSLRRLAWAGDKAAVRHLQLHDPAFLAAFERFIGESDPAAKFARYEDAARLAAAPLGDLWPADATVIEPLDQAGLWDALAGDQTAAR